jgi:DNA-binding response OmpR family regulator
MANGLRQDKWFKEGRSFMEKERVLLVEDDEDIREGVRILLESENYLVAEAENGRKGLELLDEQTDLVILDVMMPGLSGLRTCEEIRKISNVPVLFLTAKAQESDKLIGLMAGGDDYLSKPFSYAELLGRVKALVRRYKIYKGKCVEMEDEKEPYLEIGGVRIHESFNEIFVNGENIELSDIEYHILLLLMKHPQKIFSAQNLYESVWEEPYFYSCNSTVMVHIRKLRVKIEKDPKNPKYIKTVWGKGYKFDANNE